MLQVNISLMVANGDGTFPSLTLSRDSTRADQTVAPFVGHNAFLRWAAVQECAQIDPEDGVARVWSESHVSEDFQVALTLQSKGWMLRWATYSNMQFEEGVSLSAIDELARWQKYSYGCSYVLCCYFCTGLWADFC
jgi:membrane glycosyltransferase